ncbi:MAG: DUF4160 domain-containing protein [Gammaproteobacteria bacterium]|nr:DUF4160 domain-containing protein [Gammaproteobacteria bacterium]
MNLTKEMAKKIGVLYLIDPEELDGIQEYAEWLESIIHGQCSILEEDDGGELILTEIRQLVARVNGLKIEIYSNEHPPPHFHVKSPNIDASFSIDDCSKLNGNIERGDLKKIEYWHKRAKDLLIKHWNESRPTNCVVGEYVGT